MIWAVAKNKRPYTELLRAKQHKSLVIEGGERPQLESGWPQGFQDMLRMCWDHDPKQRPPFSVIVQHIDLIIAEDARASGQTVDTRPVNDPTTPPPGSSRRTSLGTVLRRMTTW